MRGPDDRALLTLNAAFPRLLNYHWRSEGPRLGAALELTRPVPGTPLREGDVLLYGYAPRKLGRVVRRQPYEIPRDMCTTVAAAVRDCMRLIPDAGWIGRGGSSIDSMLRGLNALKPGAKGRSPLFYLPDRRRLRRARSRIVTARHAGCGVKARGTLSGGDEWQ